MKFRSPLFLLFVIISIHPVFSQLDLGLEDAIKIAKQKSLLLQTQHFDIFSAQADITTAKLRYNPILNNQSLQMLSSKHFAPNTPFYNNKNRQVWWQLTQRFYVMGQRTNKIELAKQNYDLSSKDYIDKERLFLQQVSDQWLQVWMLSVNLDITTLAKRNVDTLVEINQNRLKNQVISNTEATRTLILGQQYALQLKALMQQYKNEILNLKLLLGVSDSLQVNIHEDDSLFMNQLPLLDTLVSKALANRTDIQVAKTIIKTAESNERLQKSLAFPQPEAGFIWNPQNSIPYLGVYTTLPLPVNDRNQGQIQKSKILTQQAQTNLTFKENQALTELVTAYNSYRTQQQNLKDYESIITESQDVLSRVRYSYLRGNTTFVDFLEAQRSLFETQKLYYETMFLFRQSYLQVLFASGLNNELEK